MNINRPGEGVPGIEVDSEKFEVEFVSRPNYLNSATRWKRLKQ